MQQAGAEYQVGVGGPSSAQTHKQGCWPVSQPQHYDREPNMCVGSPTRQQRLL